MQANANEVLRQLSVIRREASRMKTLEKALEEADDGKLPAIVCRIENFPGWFPLPAGRKIEVIKQAYTETQAALDTEVGYLRSVTEY